LERGKFCTSSWAGPYRRLPLRGTGCVSAVPGVERQAGRAAGALRQVENSSASGKAKCSASVH